MKRGRQQIWLRDWRADLSVPAFGKITVVYGQIIKNEGFVRKWPARKMAITDKEIKNGRLSVNLQHNGAKIYGQITGKCRFVRKMRFAYGQIIKKWHFVRNHALAC